MKNTAFLLLGFAITFCFGFSIRSVITKLPGVQADNKMKINDNKPKITANMKLGAFSMSLNVQDLEKSKLFYENLGFTVFGGSMEKKYLIMKNGNTLIGIFHGMFQGNILTFNPGWDENAKNFDPFDDVREIQKKLKSDDIKLTVEADEKTTGPAYIMLTDPDGNSILIDQHR